MAQRHLCVLEAVATLEVAYDHRKQRLINKKPAYLKPDLPKVFVGKPRMPHHSPVVLLEVSVSSWSLGVERLSAHKWFDAHNRSSTV